MLGNIGPKFSDNTGKFHFDVITCTCSRTNEGHFVNFQWHKLKL